jgi:hypothetical protein
MPKLFFFLCFFSFTLTAMERPANGYFKARVVKINIQGQLLRIHVDFMNQKYLNKGDKVSLFHENNPNKQCQTYVVGKTAEFVLLRVPEMRACGQAFFLSPGAYLGFYSEDLVKNLKTGGELMDILLKKHLVLEGEVLRTRNEINNHLEKQELVNQRYEVLRGKLEKEWSDELGLIEEDRLEALKRYERIKMELDELKEKLEKYRLEDENLKLDRWALDKNQYYLK